MRGEFWKLTFYWYHWDRSCWFFFAHLIWTQMFIFGWLISNAKSHEIRLDKPFVNWNLHFNNPIEWAHIFICKNTHRNPLFPKPTNDVFVIDFIFFHFFLLSGFDSWNAQIIALKCLIKNAIHFEYIPRAFQWVVFFFSLSRSYFTSKQNFVHKSFCFCVCVCVWECLVCSPWNLISSCTPRNARKLESYSSLGFAHGLMMKLTNCCNQFSYELFSLE